ncbi:MAG: DUF5615 family PIN-like protein [Armatimonadota bacterium]|nr:DUF5615 family PIN-like protein [bacterium]MDW8319763.1 DUF5615 family PIN-like protein [Armatimonadota bacterium]
MRIIVDENIPRRTVSDLRARGHEVIDVRGSPEEGIDDDALWQKAQQNHALLITTDKGFARFRGQQHWGVLIIRLRQPNVKRIHNRVLQVLEHFSMTEWKDVVVVARDTVLHWWHPNG